VEEHERDKTLLRNKDLLRDKVLLWTLNGVKIDVVREHVNLGLLVPQKQTGRYHWSASCHLPFIKAATVKLHSNMRSAKDIVLQPPKLSCKLFDSLMKPSLTYGSEILGWSLDCWTTTKPAASHIQQRKSTSSISKRILGVKKVPPAPM